MDADPADMLKAQYKGKAAPRSFHDVLVKYAASLGKDVENGSKKTRVALHRSKNFAVIFPATKTRIDLSVNLKDEPGTGRFLEEKPGSSFRTRCVWKRWRISMLNLKLD